MQFLNQRQCTIVSLWAVLLMGLLTLSGCTERPKNIDLKPYFFPMDSLKEAQVYRYNSTDTMIPKYIYYHSPVDDTLVIKRYNRKRQLDQISRWTVVSNGVRINTLTLFHRDSAHEARTNAKIEYDDVYPFRVRDSLDLVLFKVHWNDPLEEGRSYTVIKNRRFEDKTEFLYNGRTYPAVRMSVQEAIDDHQQGTLEIRLKGWELYAKGLGLVAWQKQYKGQVIQSYELADRLPPEEINFE